MLVFIIIASLISITVSLFFSVGLMTKIDKLEREVEILRAIVDHK